MESCSFCGKNEGRRPPHSEFHDYIWYHMVFLWHMPCFYMWTRGFAGTVNYEAPMKWTTISSLFPLANVNFLFCNSTIITSWKLTYPLKIDGWKIIHFLWKWFLFRWHSFILGGSSKIYNMIFKHPTWCSRLAAEVLISVQLCPLISTPPPCKRLQSGGGREQNVFALKGSELVNSLKGMGNN